MKTMFKTVALVLGCMFTFDSNEAIAQSEGSTYFKQNVAIANARVRSLNATTYVREMVLVDYAKLQALPTRFGFRTDGFADDGSGSDAKAGDGIYTSKDSYTHSGSVPYLRDQPVRSVVSGPITDYAFLHDQQLKGGETGGGSKMAAGPGIKVKLVRCACPQECRCLACDWGWTNWCLAVEEVEIEIGW